jgi:hypothetical protein
MVDTHLQYADNFVRDGSNPDHATDKASEASDESPRPSLTVRREAQRGASSDETPENRSEHDPLELIHFALESAGYIPVL